MRILAVTELYPPANLDGSLSLHNILTFLKSKGHEVKVMKTNIKPSESYCYEGIDVFGNMKDDLQYKWADVIITHLNATNQTIYKASRFNIPVFHLIHNEQMNSYNSVLKGIGGRNYVVYNSQQQKVFFNFDLQSIIVNPPTSFEYYNVNASPYNSTYITLISLNMNKGASIFYKIATALPDKKFLGVVGSSGNQIIESHPNVTIIPNTQNMLDVYKQTRILLMPSEMESWGRTASEAMCNGIPVIATKTKGLQENLSTSGIYINERTDIDSWVKKILYLDNKTIYCMHSSKCRTRAKELDSIPQLERFNEFLSNVLYN